MCVCLLFVFCLYWDMRLFVNSNKLIVFTYCLLLRMWNIWPWLCVNSISQHPPGIWVKRVLISDRNLLLWVSWQIQYLLQRCCTSAGVRPRDKIWCHHRSCKEEHLGLLIQRTPGFTLKGFMDTELTVPLRTANFAALCCDRVTLRVAFVGSADC